MGVKEKIKQSKFADNREKAVVNITYTQSYLSGCFNSVLKDHKISMQQFNVLRILKGQHFNPVSVLEISSRMLDKMSNASRLIDKLCTKELVIKKTSEGDRRQVDITLTSKGILKLDELNMLVRGVLQEHNNLSEVEYDHLNKLLDKFRND